MRNFDFSKDIISFISVLITIIALVSTISSPEIFSRYAIPLIIILFLVLFMYIINYFRRQIEEHKEEIDKLNEKINIYKDISDLKTKVEFLFNNKMSKRGQGDLVEVLIRVIQIGAIIFAGYIILKVLGAV